MLLDAVEQYGFGNWQVFKLIHSLIRKFLNTAIELMKYCTKSYGIYYNSLYIREGGGGLK